MVAPTTVALYGALNAIFNIFLANQVSNARKKHGVGIGLGESKELLVASRIHGNNAEFVPLALLLMLIAELLGGNTSVLHACGGVLLLARVSHMLGMPRPSPNPLRFAGVAVTWTLIVAMSGWILYLRTTV